VLTLSEVQLPEDMERDIEREIVRAFGSSLIEFEAVLLQKFLMLSAAHSLITDKMFRKHLNNMHAKGYATPVDFQGKRCWKRLIVEDDLDVIDLTPEEVKHVLRHGQPLIPQYTDRSTPIGALVSDSSKIANEIRHMIRSGHYAGKPLTPETLVEIQQHAKYMHKALFDSSEEFLKYVKRNMPSILEPLSHMLRSKGENVLLISLRLIGAS